MFVILTMFCAMSFAFAAHRTEKLKIEVNLKKFSKLTRKLNTAIHNSDINDKQWNINLHKYTYTD